MLIKELQSPPNYDIDRLEKARKGLARNSDNFYSTNSKLELIVKLMREQPASSKIIELVDSLPWRAKTFVMTNVIRVLPNGTTNAGYKEKYVRKTEVEEDRINNTRRTQVATTGGTYEKTGAYLRDIIPKDSKIISIGAGLDHTRERLRKGLGNEKFIIHDHEPYPENRKTPPEFTSAKQIPRSAYNAVVSHNVLNVVEPKVRDQVMDSLFKSVAAGGHIIIGVRRWQGDVDTNKNYELGDEPKSMWVKKSGGELSYQKGFDGDELKDYVEDYAARRGYDVTVKKLKNIASNSVHVVVNRKPRGK